MPAVPAAFLARIAHRRRDLVFGGGLSGLLDFEPDTGAVALSVTFVDVNADSSAEQKFGIAAKTAQTPRRWCAANWFRWPARGPAVDGCDQKS
jgi:hypothetical protein